MTARRALVGGAILMVFRDVMQFGAMIVMTRMLTPSDYGRFALVSGTITALTIFSARPMLEYVPIAQETIDQRSYFWTSGVMQLVPLLLVGVLSVVPGPFSRDPDLAGVLLVCAVFFSADWFASFRLSVLFREQNWERIQYLSALSTVASLGAGLLLAAAGWGAMALMWQVPLGISFMALDGVRSVLQHRYELRPEAVSRMAAVCKPGIKFGFFRIISGVLSGGRPMMEGVMMVSASGYALLGQVNRAVGLPNQFLGRVPTLLQGMLQPFLAAREMQGMDSLRRANRIILSGAVWLLLPVAGLLFEWGAWVASVLYGKRWEAVGPLVRIACLYCLSSAVLQVGISMLNARRRSHVSAVLDGIGFVGIAVGLYFLERGGAPAYLVSVGLFQLVALVLMLVRLVREELLTARDVLEITVYPAILAGGLFVAPWIGDDGGLGLWAGVGRSIVALVLYVLYFRFFAAERLRSLVEASGTGKWIGWVVR